jgi:hypothetical protein
MQVIRRLVLLLPSAQAREAPQDTMSDSSDHQGSPDIEQCKGHYLNLAYSRERNQDVLGDPQ